MNGGVTYLDMEERKRKAAAYDTLDVVPASSYDDLIRAWEYLDRENRDLRCRLRERERMRRLKWPVWVLSAWGLWLLCREKVR